MNINKIIFTLNLSSITKYFVNFINQRFFQQNATTTSYETFNKIPYEHRKSNQTTSNLYQSYLKMVRQRNKLLIAITEKETNTNNKNQNYYRKGPFSKLNDSGKTNQLNKNIDYYYSILGLQPVASIKDIKLAYYNLAKKYHPDAILVNTNQSQSQSIDTTIKKQSVKSVECVDDDHAMIKKQTSFQEIHEAYEHLIDDTRNLLLGNHNKIDGTLEKLQKIPINRNNQLKSKYIKSDDNNFIIVPVTFLQSLLNTDGYSHDIYLNASVPCSCSNSVITTNITTNNKESNLTKSSKNSCVYCKGTGIQIISTTFGKFKSKQKCKYCCNNNNNIIINANGNSTFNNNNNINIKNQVCTICYGKRMVQIGKRHSITIPFNVKNGDIQKMVHPFDSSKSIIY